MSEVAFVDSHADRRQHVRRHVQRLAELVMRDAQASHFCTILDESQGGVRIQADDAGALPDEAVIRFSDTASQLVRRCWASGNRAGYQFVEIVPVERHYLQEESVAPRQVDTLALNNFVAMSRTLLNLFVEAPANLHSIEQICARLSEVPHAPMEEPASEGAVGAGQQRLIVPETTNRRSGSDPALLDRRPPH